MLLDRRRLLALTSLLPLVATPLLCPARAASRPRRQPVALLVPRTGPHAALGLSMERAASLAQSDSGEPAMTIDTGGTADGAAAAAIEALRRGARLILGPLFAAEVRPVVAAVAGRAPVIAFSNDPALADSGAFLLGITPSQATSAVLQYARSRGVRTVAVLAGGDAWARQSAAAAERLQGAIGIDVVSAANVAALTGGATLPDAVLLSDGAADFAATATALRASGIQILGTTQAIDHAPAALAATEGAWLAAPDPAALADFARAYAERNGGAPGMIAALAYDAARIAGALRTRGEIGRDALLAAPNFPGVVGNVRFRADGSCSRELAILLAGADGYSVVGHSVAA